MQQPESIDIVAAEVREQMAVQLRHLERLDAQAGVLLGFAGLFVAVAPDSRSPWVAAARLAAVVAATGALLTFLARAHPTVGLVELREMVSAEPASAQIALIDTHIALAAGARQWIDQKAKYLTVTTSALFVAILLAVVGQVVDNPP